jgi:hypothetical protein
MGRRIDRDVAAHVRALEDAAVKDKGVSAPIAARAGRATCRWIAGAGATSSVAQARAYFWGAVRRQVARDSGSTDVRARFLLAALFTDLRESGRSPEAVWSEIERGWGHRVPAHVLEEFRTARCA